MQSTRKARVVDTLKNTV